ncbi:MAG: hypothetical protein E7359_03175 [Clostridiales bacterium]|nr:hypothetical protein [Clostridiales bacterium]
MSSVQLSEEERKQKEREKLNKQIAALNADVAFFNDYFMENAADEMRVVTLDAPSFYNLAFDIVSDLKEEYEQEKVDKTNALEESRKMKEQRRKEINIELAKYGVQRTDDIFFTGRNEEKNMTTFVVEGETFRIDWDNLSENQTPTEAAIEVARTRLAEDVLTEIEESTKKLANLKPGIFTRGKIKALEEKIAKLKQDPGYLKFKAIEESLLATADISTSVSDVANEGIAYYFSTTSLEERIQDCSRSVFELNFMNLYVNNFEYLSMFPLGALETLKLKLDKHKNNKIFKETVKNIDELEIIYQIAYQLHEDWREGFKNEDGTYKPRFRPVKDKTTIESLSKMKELPENFRFVDGHYEQNITNATFNELCGNYQLENFEAAKIAYKVALMGYKNSEKGKAGKIIHDEWLKRNPSAKGSDLDVEFIDLIESEKMKDLIHVKVAKQKMAEYSDQD